MHRVKELIGNEDHRLQYLAQHFKHIVKDRFSRGNEKDRNMAYTSSSMELPKSLTATITG